MEPLLEEHERVMRKATPVAAIAGIVGIIVIIWILAWSVT
jgi:hypothetical protein